MCFWWPQFGRFLWDAVPDTVWTRGLTEKWNSNCFSLQSPWYAMTLCLPDLIPQWKQEAFVYFQCLVMPYIKQLALKETLSRSLEPIWLIIIDHWLCEVRLSQITRSNIVHVSQQTKPSPGSEFEPHWQCKVHSEQVIGILTIVTTASIIFTPLSLVMLLTGSVTLVACISNCVLQQTLSSLSHPLIWSQGPMSACYSNSDQLFFGCYSNSPSDLLAKWLTIKKVIVLNICGLYQQLCAEAARHLAHCLTH